MSAAKWIIAISVFVLILFIALGIGFFIRRNVKTNPPVNRYSNPLIWSPPIPSDNPAKNTCQLYQFQSMDINYNFNGTLIPSIAPGQPTLNSYTLNQLQGVAPNPQFNYCVDSDQIIAIQAQHQCTGPNGVIDDSINLCNLSTGGTTGLGGIETFYTECGMSSLGTYTPACNGQISLISLNFVPADEGGGLLMCMTSGGTAGSQITMTECNPTNPNQIFRVTRVPIGSTPTSKNQGNEGVYTQFLDRRTNLCIQPDTTPSTYTSKLILTECTGGYFGDSYPGFVWATLPSFIFCDQPGGCNCSTRSCVLGNNSNVICNIVYGTGANHNNTCTLVGGDCQTCSGYLGVTTIPQIVSLDSVPYMQMPVGTNASYNGLTGDNATFQWLIDNQALSLNYNTSILGLSAIPINAQQNSTDNNGYIPQYLSLNNYLILSEQNVCYAENPNNTSNSAIDNPSTCINL